MNRTQRLSRTLRRFASLLFGLCLFGLVFSPGLVFLDGFALDSANHLLRLLDVDGFRFNAGHVGWMLRTFVGVLTAGALATAVLSLGVLIRLLHQFEGGTAFSQESVRLVRFLGWIQVAGALVGLLMFGGLAAVTKALTAQVIHPWGHAVGSSLDGLFFGGITLLVAHVLDEGFRLKSEQELVI
jgi:hypothetical protein